MTDEDAHKVKCGDCDDFQETTEGYSVEDITDSMGPNMCNGFECSCHKDDIRYCFTPKKKVELRNEMRERLSKMETYRLWHTLWTKAVGIPDYSKEEWKELDGRLFYNNMFEPKGE